MAETGLSGPYGLWEAVDFTSSRTGGGPICVRCVMAHHLGMSLCAIANALCGGVLRRWFFSDPAMAAYTGLFCRRRSPPAENSSAACRGAREERERAGSAAPRTGEGRILFPGRRGALERRVPAARDGERYVPRFMRRAYPYRSARTPWENAPGIALWAESGGVRQPLLPKPGEKGALRWRFTAGKALLAGQSGDLLWEMRCTVSRAYPGELRRLRLCSGKTAPDAVIFGFEPVLLDTRDYAAHPAFARLGLCTSVRSGVLIVYRAPRGNQSAQYLALACSGEAGFSSDFRQFPARGGGEFRENTGWQNEPYIAARLPLPEGSACEIALALCVAGDADTAAQSAREMLRESSGFAMADAAAAVWGMESGESAAAMEYLRALTFPPLCAEGRALPGGTRDALWRLGISGDLPSWCSTAGKTARKPRSVSSGGTRCSARAAWSTISCFSPRPPGITGTSSARRSKRRLRQCAFPKRSLPGGVYFAFRGEREALLAAAALFGDAAGTSLPAGRARALRLPRRREKRDRYAAGIPYRHRGGELSNAAAAAARMGKYALWRRSRLRRGGLRPGGALVRKRPGVPHRPVVGRRARRGGRGTAVDRNGARRGESLFGWRRVQRNVRLRLYPLGENHRREPHFGHGVYRARYAGACAPARERRAVQYGVFCTCAACTGERGRGFRVRLARRERSSRGKPALPVQGCARDAAVQRAVGLGRNGRALPLRRRLRRSPPRLPGAGRGVPAGKRGGNAARHGGYPCTARHRAGQRSAGKDKGVVGAARAGAKSIPPPCRRACAVSRRGARMPRSAAACWAEEASTRAAARSASGISCRTASTSCPSTPRARERTSLRAAPTSTRRATCSTGIIRPAARSTRACAPTAATIFSGCRGQCANMCARPPTSLCAETAPYLTSPPPLARGRAQPVRNAVALRRDRHGARPLPPRRGARASARYRRAPPAADGRRRLERRL